MESQSLKLTRVQKFLQELLEEIQDPIHARLIKAYDISNPVPAMESELHSILMGIMSDEDQEHNS